MSAPSTSGKILRNTIWYGLETGLEVVLFLGASIAVARYLGPQKLGYLSSVMFPVVMISAAGGTGLAIATRKYMSEMLGQDRPGLAHAVYRFTNRYQFVTATLIALIGLAVVLAFMPHEHRLMASILVLSVIPGLMAWTPAQANLAFEDAASNAFSAFGYMLVYTGLIAVTIWRHWDLVGIAVAFAVSRLVETVLRVIPLHRKLARMPIERLPTELKKRIGRFCLQAAGIQVLTSVVWDRSEIFFLTAFSGPIQIAYYSVAAGLVDRLLVFPRTLSTAAGVSLMAESARDAARVRPIVYSTVRFLLLFALPVHVGAAIITRQAITIAYGSKYLPAVTVMIVAALLSVPRALQLIPDTIMRSADRQWDLMRAMVYIALVNIALDFAFIPRYGAIGAAIGNGVAQAIGIAVLWLFAKRSYDFGLPVQSILRISAATGIMGAVAFAVSRAVPNNLLSLIAAIVVAVPVYVWMLRVFRVLDPGDYSRFLLIGKKLPGSLSGAYAAAVRFAIPRHVEALPIVERAHEVGASN